MTATEKAIQFSAWTVPDGTVFHVNAWIAERPKGTSNVMADFRFKQKSSKVVNGKSIARYEREGPMPTTAQIEEMEARIAGLRK